MNKKAHLFGGVVFFFLGIMLIICVKSLSLPNADLVISFFEKSTLIGSALGLITVVFGAILPDILDPPFSRKHRRFAHSKILFIIMLALYMVTLFSLTYGSMKNELGIWGVHFFLLGYLSHLVLDSFTPAGLW